jgi:regulator of replication initiation timing
MATTSIADKLAKLEKKIAKREKTIADEQEQLNKEMEEYNKLYLTALASKFKLSGKDLFSAIEREHEQLEKLREGEQSDDDADDTSSVTDDADKQDDTAVKHSSFPHSYSGGN